MMKLNDKILAILRSSMNESVMNTDAGSIEDQILSSVKDNKLKKEIQRYIANNVTNRVNKKYIANLNLILNGLDNKKLYDKLVQLNDAQDMLR